MITVLAGENSFEIERALNKITSDFNGVVEKVDGAELKLSQLPDILMGASLFSDARTVVIRSLSENKSVWPVLGDWLPKISEDIHLVLVESKPDKRTNSFKALQKHTNVSEFVPWEDRDIVKAEKWVAEEAKTLDLALDKKGVQTLVEWVGVNQWALFNALKKLSLSDEVTSDSIKEIIDASPFENVFNLFETALNGNINEVSRMLRILEQTEDVFRLTALLLSQAFQMAAVISAQKNINVTKDFGIHPYVVQKLSLAARKLGKDGVSKIINIFAELDDDMKTSKTDPWLLVERALIKVSTL